MLWTEKYRPKDLSSVDYQKEQAIDLKNLTQHGDFPHLLVYGPMGAGKKTRIMCLLRELFGPGVDRIKPETMNFTTPSNKKLEIVSTSSNYHIELNPSDVGIYDRIVIMDVIKNVAQTQQLNMNATRDFKVIVLTDVDNLTKDAQHALRRTMEKYVSNCRIILCTTSISSVISPIRSRCLCIRVAAPSEPEIAAIITHICQKEGFQIAPPAAAAIATKSRRNLRQAILMCQAQLTDSKTIDEKNIREPDWKLFIEKIANDISKNQTVQTLANVRKDLYEVIVGGIPMEIVFQVLVNKLLEFCDRDVSNKLVELAAFYQHRVTKSNKEIIHLEAFVANFMSYYQEMLQGYADF